MLHVLKPITGRVESKTLFEAIKSQWIEEASTHDKIIGFQGGGHLCSTYWRPDVGIWGVFEPTTKTVKNRFWICWGNIYPENSFNIIVETNPPLEGINKRVSGLFLEDNHGHKYLAHSGRVGGGRKGIGKNAFCSFTKLDNWITVLWPDVKTSQYLLLGEIGSSSLIQGIKGLVNEVARFKEWAVTQTTPINNHSQIT